jgi:SAM-dependent methyltransferase
MMSLVSKALWFVISVPLLAIVLHTVVRIVRRFHKFPIPERLAGVIDNPLRRRIQPPGETAVRSGLAPGMRALEIGPGSGSYTVAAARHVGDAGSIVTVDIEPKMLKRVAQRIRTEGIENTHAGAANAHSLPFRDDSFDAVYSITVIGEIPDPSKAIREFHRVLRKKGTLAFSELLLDPDFPRASTLMRWADGSGFRLRHCKGNVVHYTLVFGK